MKNAAVPVAVIADLDLFRLEEEFLPLAEIFLPENVTELKTLRQNAFAFPEDTDRGDTAVAALTDVRTWLALPNTDDEVRLRGANWLKNRLQDIAGGRTRWDRLKKEGVKDLDPDLQALAEELLNRCAAAGLFVVPVGEIESWFGVAKGKAGVSTMLEMISRGESPPALIDFVDRVLAFLNDAARQSADEKPVSA